MPKTKQMIDERISTLEKDVMDSSQQLNPAETTTVPSESSILELDKEAIVSQCIREIQFARRYKQGKIRNWQKNEEMLYGKKINLIEARSNVDLARMQEHVHTILSRIDEALIFKFNKRKESQLKRVQRLNALRTWDAQRDNWDIKDLVGKKQAIVYGRAAYMYYADSIDGIYKPHLENIDIYDLLVDPSGGGIDVENMLYWGRYGVVKSKEELEEMGKTATGYEKTALAALVSGTGNNTESTQEETNKMTRMYGQNTIGQKNLQSDEKYKFWQWFTTYKGVRYVVTLNEKSGSAIDICPLQEKFESNLWPMWTYAAFLDLTEFWTPSYCDHVREMFQAQNVTINQMLDNAEAINKPMKVVDITAIQNLSELKYRRDGVIKVSNGVDAQKAMQVVQTPSINTPLAVFDKMEAIIEKASGVTGIDTGTAEADGKVAIYEGNKQASAGRYGLLNKAYSFGYDRFALLYQWGVRENLIKKVAVDIIGPNGIETESFSRKDIFRKNDDFRTSVESSNADKGITIEEQTSKVQFLNNELALDANRQEKIVNTKKAFEIKAKMLKLTDDEVKELMDVSEYGDAGLMSEAARDMELILDGEDIKANANANNAYKQRFVDYMKDHKEDMTDKQWSGFVSYMSIIEPVVVANEARNLQLHQTDMLNAQSMLPPAPITPNQTING